MKIANLGCRLMTLGDCRNVQYNLHHLCPINAHTMVEQLVFIVEVDCLLVIVIVRRLLFSI